MKTTVEIPGNLLGSAKRFAAERNLTLRELIIQGLRLVLENSRAARGKFKLKDESVSGNGINPEFESGWNSIRDAIYTSSGKLP